MVSDAPRRTVLVIGAYGLIGSAVAARLHAEGWAVVALGRDTRTAARRAPWAGWIDRDLAALRRPEDWRPLLDGVEAIVNCAGLLQAGRGDDLAAVHVDATAALTEAAIAAGIRRYVHVSAAGIDGADTGFSRTKRAAEELLDETALDYVILRPGLVLAPAAYGGSALLRAVAALPVVMPIAHAKRVVRVVAVGDVAEAVLRTLGPDGPSRVTIDLMADEPTTLSDILAALRGWLGLAPARVVNIPPALLRPVACAADGLAWLGWRSPLRSTTLAQLAVGVDGDTGACRRLLGFQPIRLGEMLARMPAGVQESWFARLYLLKPLAIGTLAAFWAASGLIGLFRLDAAADVLAQAGFGMAAARIAVIVGAVVDILLAGLVLVRRHARIALVGMVVVSSAYLAGGTLVRPDLWLDPLGPLVKVLPGMMLAGLTAAILDDR